MFAFYKFLKYFGYVEDIIFNNREYILNMKFDLDLFLMVAIILLYLKKMTFSKEKCVYFKFQFIGANLFLTKSVKFYNKIFANCMLETKMIDFVLHLKIIYLI